MDWSNILSALLGAAVGLVPWWIDRRRNNSDAARLSLEGADWLDRKGQGYDQLLAALISLDRAALPDLTDVTGGTVAKKARVFRKSPETWALVVYNDCIVVGYWSCFSLSDELKQRLVNGNMYDSEIDFDEVKLIEEAGPHHLYFEMIGIHPGFSWCAHHIRDLLYSSLGAFFELVSKPESQVAGIYANGFSNDGAALCKQMGMKRIAPSIQGGSIFAAYDVPAIAKRARARALRSRIVASVRG